MNIPLHYWFNSNVQLATPVVKIPDRCDRIFTITFNDCFIHSHYIKNENGDYICPNTKKIADKYVICDCEDKKHDNELDFISKRPKKN